MNSEEIINAIKSVVEGENCTGIAAIQKNGEISIITRGNEQALAGSIITLLGADQISSFGLSIIGAYCIAHAKGLKGFGNANKFADYLMGCAEVYFQHSDMMNPNTRGLS